MLYLEREVVKMPKDEKVLKDDEAALLTVVVNGPCLTRELLSCVQCLVSLYCPLSAKKLMQNTCHFGGKR